MSDNPFQFPGAGLTTPTVVEPPGGQPQTGRPGALPPSHLLLLAVTVLMVVAGFIGFGLNDSIIKHFPDDALFYNIVARNVARGLGSTTDLIGKSNGYHPLWAVTLMGLSRVFGGATLWAEIALMAAVLLANLALLYRLLAGFLDRHLALLLCLFASFEQTYFRVLFNGLETPLAFLALLAVANLLRGQATWAGLSARRWGLLAGALTLLFFARLDGGMMWMIVALVFLVQAPITPGQLLQRSRRLLALFALPTLLALGYMAFNHHAFGTLMPISGRIKAATYLSLRAHEGWGAVLLDALAKAYRLYSVDLIDRALRAVGRTPALLMKLQGAYLVAVAVLLVWGVRRLASRRQLGVALPVLATYTALHTFYYLFMQGDQYSLSWARGPELLLTTIAVGCLVQAGLSRAASLRLGPPRLWRQASIAGLLALSLAYGVYRGRMTNRVSDFDVDLRDFHAMTGYIHTTLPPGTVIASPSIGFLGYFSGYPVFSLDGLINSLDYYNRYLRPGRVIDALKDHQVRYLAIHVPRGADPVSTIQSQAIFRSLKREQIQLLKAFPEGNPPRRSQNRYALFQLKF